MKDVTMAMVSLTSRPAEPAENLERHVPWLAAAKAEDATLCCFPEMSVTGFCFDYGRHFRAAEPIGGESTARMVELAAEYDLRIGFGMASRDERDIVRNTYIFVSAEGVLGTYSKTHIPILEYGVETPGHEFSVVNLGDVRIGVNICFDNWFAEAGRLSYLNGAEVILAPFWMGSSHADTEEKTREAFDYWRQLATINFPAVAWQNGVYHVTINSCGGVHEKGVDYEGPPIIFVFNPLGELEVDTSPDARGERMVVHALRATTLVERRSQSHFHPKYRRPEIYSDLSRL
ncbi:MAG TPA: carbon-nitrogen hydrolase family protein [Armatimonadota bacterium]|nr:carbon-nitrogen hydrolase family protein [Armatimonadota bacterium]